MKKLAELSLLAVALAAAGSVAAQNADSVAQTQLSPVADKAVAQAASPAQAMPVKAVADTLVTRLPGDTHVRIVRLSQVQGKVGMDRGTGHGVEISMQNMPIAENMALGTSKDDSYAEVEFEDGSTLRLGPDTAVAFPQLVLRASGARATIVRVDRGTVYVSRDNAKSDEFALVIGGTRKIDVSPSTHLRMELDGTKAAIAVFSGNAAVEGESGSPLMVGKKQTLSFDIAGNSVQVELAKKVEEGPFDGWDQDAQKYHERYAKANSLLGNGYGVGDLNYYGSFVNVGGGLFWQPYFVGAGWSPYGNGLWALYPGGIYSWVSPYPWGWLPFHSGTWTYIPSFGWGWQPGGTFVGVNNVGSGHLPVRGPGRLPGGLLPRPPLVARDSLVAVNQQPLVISRPEAGGKFVFRNDSAGLGVPRGSMGKLGGISQDVAHHGFSNRDVYVAPAGSPSRWNDGQVYHGPLAFHRGSMPDEARQAMWARQQAATGAMQPQHSQGQFAAGSLRSDHTPGQNGASSGWQGRQGQPAQLSTANGLAWKQGGTNAAPAGANGSHSWNNAGAGAGASGHTWNGSNAGGAASTGGHTWNGGGNAGASAGGGGHTWSGGGGNAGGGGTNAGGGGHWSGGGGAPASTGGGGSSGGSSSGSAGSHK
ncbi:MAG: FecR domain-containing protein [Acidobacteria bacterium]|nr:FecR domain-containing protein [Acidobacteriota bacterium]